MRVLFRGIAAGGVAAFFFFSWILQLLWNSILFDQLALVPTQVTYWQSAGLWFFVTILFAWTGFGARPSRWVRPSRRVNWDDVGDRIERRIKARVSQWADDNPNEDIGNQIEAKIKRGLSRWVGVDEDIDWDDLGDHIERKIKRHLRDWMDETDE
jgi:hypothetical protein